MIKYQTPKIEIEVLETEDIIATSTGLGENETPVVGGGGRPRTNSTYSSGSIAGGSTVSSIVGSGDANTFSVGDMLGH